MNRTICRAVWTLELGLSVLFAATATAGPGDVVINEIHYAPANKTVPEEFIELYNAGDIPVDLTGWSITGAVSFDFPAGRWIAPDEYLVVAQDPATLQSIHGVSALGPFSGRLSNDGETVYLRGAFGLAEDGVDYGRGFPWPTVGGDMGSSIELVHPSLDNQLGGSWRASGVSLDESSPRVDLIARGDPAWRYRKGTSEASSPVSAWRTVDFEEDASWLVGQTSIGYGDGDDATTIGDMQNAYSSMFLRRSFQIESAEDIPTRLKLEIYVDDGAIVWLNGIEIGRFHVAGGAQAFDALGQNHEAAWEDVSVTAGNLAALQVGENILAIHAFNGTLGSSDFSIDAALFVPSSSEGAGGEPTPGAPNSILAEDSPPQLRQVEHDPQQPRSGDPVIVSVKATDPDGVAAVSLSYQEVDPGSYIRLDDPGYETDWTTVPMLDGGEGGDLFAGDDVYTAMVPAAVQTHRRLVRYRIFAEDANGAKIRAPYLDDPQPNFAYFVYDGVPAWRGASRPGTTPIQTFDSSVMTSLPVYHLIAVEQDVINCQYNSAFDGVHFRGTLIYEGRVYDHIEFENRGEFSTYQSGKNKWRFHFHRGHDFQARDNHGRPYQEKWRTMNFNACATPWVPTNRGMAGLGEAVAFKLYGLAGVPSPSTHYVHFRIVDESLEAHPSDQYRGDLWGLYLTNEHPDGAFLDERGLPDGNVYKIEGGNGDKKNQGPTQTTSASDYNALKSGYNSSPAVSWWRANVNLEVYYSFRGINRGVNNMDLREGWNLFQYHDPETNLWSVIPWDLDMLYMPVTHWSGVMSFQNSLSRPELNIEYENRARELQDLLLSPDQVAQIVDELAALSNPPGRPLTFVDIDEAMWNYHPRTSGSHRGMFYRNPSTHSARGGTITRTLVSANHEGMAQWIEDFLVTGYGANQVRSEAGDGAIPRTPTVEATGSPQFPVDDLSFRCSAFDDPQGAGTFSAMKWRAARVARPGSPPVDPVGPKPVEIDAAWESDLLTTFSSEIVIPADALQIGSTYRVRARMMDSTGRWSHWSEPVEFTTSGPDQPFPAQRALRITELMYHPPEGVDLEFVELRNLGSEPMDLRSVSFTNGIRFDFGAGDIQELAPGQFVVVVKNRLAFESKYGDDLPVAGEFTKRLDNDGDRVTLVYGANAVILDFVYSDLWYPLTDGAGHSLVVVDPEEAPSTWNDLENWRESENPDGTPGWDDSGVLPGGRQRPGDLNQDSNLEIGDPVRLLLLLFRGDAFTPPCEGSTVTEGGNVILADFNGDTAVDSADAVAILQYLFRSGPAHASGELCVRIEGCPRTCGL